MSEPHSVVTAVTVVAVTRVSPTFTRIEFGGPELAEFGLDGPIHDQRIKLIFPVGSGPLPSLEAGDDWYNRWLAIPEAERGAMRTYSIRDLYGEESDRRLVVDFVLHLVPGATGPASSWASRATVGDQVIVVGPRRGVAWGGIEFAPGAASRILLAGDETAVPAMTRILADLPATTVGHAFLEVPDEADTLTVKAPTGFTLRWLPRGHHAVGTRLIPAVLAHFGSGGSAEIGSAEIGSAEIGSVAIGQDTMWETPTYSGSGEELTTINGTADLYAWIAGESGMVTTMRRHLVKDLGIGRSQVAFMGYWRTGVAMRG